ncbi:hypothetical protein SAMN04488134_105183 [Amphibacillus marinus]|uniref:Methionine synthase n=1 Tax=Amphibacillus marinus TaxID=872970 RepID=A0A1H8NAA9_9BACI|nr:hypothetical protein [Amphibacillus marinus]SEO26544.1 hypothetical protein SAMN04488134_105183 [Amphibacillus marinus]
MNNLFIGLTLGNDPHTVGIHKAAKLAKLAGIAYMILPPALSDDEKIKTLIDQNPRFIGLSYRLSVEPALSELKKFLERMEEAGLFKDPERRVGFSGLFLTLDAISNGGLLEQYPIELIGSDKQIEVKTNQTLNFFQVAQGHERDQIVELVRQEANPKKVPLLDELASEVVDQNSYLSEQPLKKPSEDALKHLPNRMKESAIPLIRTHFGIPSDSIDPTVQGIIKLAEQGAVDEVSLGSSDLSQRYFGNEQAFQIYKNDGGVPYKNKAELAALFEASRRGNFPSVKPYAHVYQLKPFVDTCLETGMLVGAHQAVPLFWFSQLDGRGPLSVPDAIQEHIETVEYLASKNIPVEMNDPNQWSSRFIHDALFVVDYALIAAVMYASGVKDMIFQHQFNKPAETGDYADLAKMAAAKVIIEQIRPEGNQANVYLEARAGIEHFSTDLEVAKFQLARTTLLQMIFDPNMFHLVSYCEASHAATADDVIESAKIVRRSAKLFKDHEAKLKKVLTDPIVVERKQFLLNEAMVVLKAIASLSKAYREDMDMAEWYQCLADPQALSEAMARRYMTAPGITLPDYENTELLTKIGRYGFIDCYASYDDARPLTEQERLERLHQYV